jgi:hypothetical protein
MRDSLKDAYKTTFSKYQVTEDKGEWEAIQNRVKFNNFRRFNWMKFNLYYAMAILVSLLLTGLQAGHYFYQSGLQYSLQQKKTQSSVSMQPKSDKTVSNMLYSSEKKLKDTSGSEQNKSGDSAVEGSITVRKETYTIPGPEETIATTQRAGSDSLAKATQDSASNPEGPFIEVKKVVIIKQDTIYRTEKRKKKLFFNY